MSDRQLFRQLALHFGVGTILGTMGSVWLLASRSGISDLIWSGANPLATVIILAVGGSLYLGFNVAMTGFCFAVVADDRPRRRHS